MVFLHQNQQPWVINFSCKNVISLLYQHCFNVVQTLIITLIQHWKKTFLQLSLSTLFRGWYNIYSSTNFKCLPTLVKHLNNVLCPLGMSYIRIYIHIYMYTSVKKPAKCHFQKGLKNAIEKRRLLNRHISFIFKDIYLLFVLF